jgi:hypothetical protein
MSEKIHTPLPSENSEAQKADCRKAKGKLLLLEQTGNAVGGRKMKLVQTTDISEKDQARFWRKVDKNGPVIRPELGPCWTINVSINPNGYRYLKIGRKRKSIHRLAWAITFGAFPDGLQVCHKCDNRVCCRPKHLFVGTAQDNVNDAKTKGRLATGDRSGARLHPERMPRGDRNGARLHPERIPRGERHWRSVLNDDQVRSIKALLSSGSSMHAIARLYRVCVVTIWKIAHGRSWAHITQ